VAFFPADANVIDDGATQLVAADAEGLRLTLRRDKTQPVPAVVNGVLTFRDTTAQVGGALNAIVISSPIAFAPPDAAIGLGFVAAVLFGVLGGLVLNLMPYVLPVLSIKVLALIEHSGLTPREMRLQGVVYAAGVLVSFTLLGGALLGLRAAGAEIGWGFQLQSPVFVATMVYLLFAVGLNLSGVFSIGNRMAGVGGDLASRPGYSSAFFTGALATLVATPCTAPFMAAAIGYAVTQPWYASLAVLEAIGLGLALPYVAITVSPRARRLLPKPGIWMLRLKEVLAFPVYGTTVWLVYVLSQLADAFAVTAVLTGLVLIGFATWLHGAAQGSKGAWRNGGLGLSTLAAVGAVALLYLVQDGGPAHAPQTVQRGGIQWQPFSGASLEALRAEGRPVFVDFTASWCITCKVNERIALADPAVVNAFANGGIVALKADWTRHDASITQMLEANGHAGVPLYLLYRGHAADGASKPPIVLPQLLTVSSILRALQED
jgi:thiol:disulfide interchange protein DsbD